MWRYMTIPGIESMETRRMIGGLNVKTYVINLDKDTKRYTKLLNYYQKSDLSDIPLERYSAVVGLSVDPSEWLSSDALTEMNQVMTNGYRTHHHQLTMGGLGCFLSHYNLAKQLLSDNKSVDAYLILEDDTAVPENISAYIEDYLADAPDDWDYILFYTIRATGGSATKTMNRLKSFWGLNGYLINKRGAQKLIDEIDVNKIDGQIDSYLSRMIQQNKLSVYATKKHLVKSNAIDTNIQVILKPIQGVNPFNFKGYII
jgi:GR25 family glycosyltransferase involved in LPS biosynthesis